MDFPITFRAFLSMGITRFYYIGLAIFFACVGAAVYLNQISCDWQYCKDQLTRQCSNLQQANQELEQAKLRLSGLKDILTDKNNPGFLTVRQEIKNEQQVIGRLQSRIRGLKIRPLTAYNLVFGLGWNLVPFILGMGVAYWLLNNFAWMVQQEDGKPQLSGWQKPFTIIVALLFVTFCLQGVITGIVDFEKKAWFGAFSFSYAPWSFVFLNLMTLGVSMAFSVPVTFFYCASDKAYLPKVDLHNPRGDCGVGEYLSTAEHRTLVGSVTTFVPVVLWIRSITGMSGDISPGHLLTPLLIVLGALYLLVRQILCVVEIRKQYYQKVAALGKDWETVASIKVPPDPTLGFIGKEWWRLPTVVYPVVGGVWFFAEFLGVADVVLKQFR